MGKEFIDQEEFLLVSFLWCPLPFSMAAVFYVLGKYCVGTRGVIYATIKKSKSFPGGRRTIKKPQEIAVSLERLSI